MRNLSITWTLSILVSSLLLAALLVGLTGLFLNGRQNILRLQQMLDSPSM